MLFLFLVLALSSPSNAYSGLTEISDREYLLSIINERERQYQQRFDAQEKALSSALSAAKEAVDKAEKASEKRFDAVNEFRSQLRDQQNTLLPRNEYLTEHRKLEENLNRVSNQQVPRMELQTRWQAEEIRFKELKDRMDLLASRQFRDAGAQEGRDWLWGVIAGVIGLIIAIGALSIRLREKTVSS